MSQTIPAPDFSAYCAELQKVLSRINPASVASAVELIRSTWQKNRQVVTCGNGGSALTASHFITDWAKMAFLATGRPFRGLCLNDNIGMLTAYANDLSYADVFAKAAENYLQADDLLIVVTGSGNSTNVVRVIESAHALGARTLALCGYDGGKVLKLAQCAVWTPSFDMQLCEDSHLIFGHLVMKALAGSPLKVAE